MPYVPRPATTAQCAHCGTSFEKRHASRRYCSNSCNVQASYARNGRPGDGRATRADLEQALAKMTQLVELMAGKPAPAAKAATKPAKKAVSTVKKKITTPAPAAEAAATKPKPAKKAVSTSKKGITTPAPAAKAAATKPKKKITATLLSKEEQLRQAKLQVAVAAAKELARKLAAEEQPRNPREVYRR